MVADAALIEKREDLKRRLAAGEYKTLVDLFLEWFNRLLQKITRRSKPFPVWFIAIILSISLILLSLATVYISGDITTFLVLTTASGGLGTLALFLEAVADFAIAIIMNQYLKRIFALWHEEVLDATQSVASLDDFEDWLKKTCNWSMHLLVTMIIAIASVPVGIYVVKMHIGISIGYGSMVALFVAALFSNAFIYLFVEVILLSTNLHRYDLKLFAADPSSSDVISRLSSEFSSAIYIIAIYGIVELITLDLFRFVVPLAVFEQILLVWMPIIILFVLIQSSLSAIIRRVKWKTLNEIQGKVEELQAGGNFEDKETMETINRLMDYHDRVKATSNSALNSGGVLHFINSLLLPLVALLLGNLQVILKLFAR